MIKLWHDLWCAGGYSKESFPGYVHCSLCKVCFSAKLLEISNSSFMWNVSLISTAHDLEVEALTTFSNLYSTSM